MARAVLLLTVLLLAGCAAASGSGSPTPDAVGEWELVSGRLSGAPLPQPPGARATLTLDGVQAVGTSFCNSYSGGYAVDGDSIRFEGLGRTEIGCEPDVIAAESAYVTALGAVGTVAVDGDDLLLTGTGVELRFHPVPPVRPSSLAGTDWRLETLVDGALASSGTGRSSLRLEHDGTFTATAPCTTLTGRWQPTGDTLTFPEVAGESGTCPPDAATEDELVFAVLAGGPQVSIEENRLTAVLDDGRGLVYRDGGSR